VQGEVASSMAKEKNKYMCCLCGEFSELNSNMCSVNIHEHCELALNEKGNMYLGSTQQGYSHLSCFQEKFKADSDSECALCNKPIKVKLLAIKLAVYVYRKRGDYSLVSCHSRCFRKEKHSSFPLFKA
jgi:hypothetical protein